MPQDRPSITGRAYGASASGEASRPPPRGEEPVPAGLIRGIGITIESLASFPEAENYLEHEFYQLRFAPAELVYCSRQESPRSSYCALAAIKRAVLKSGAVTPVPESLAAIEITRDEAGEPFYPDCFISLDQSEATVVAVCLWTRESSGSAAAPLPLGRPLASFPPLQRLGIRVFMALVGLSLLFIFGSGVWFILSQIFH